MPLKGMHPLGVHASTEKVSGDREKAQARFSQEYPLSILLADDNYINRRVLILFLQSLGYHPIGVENGVECLNAAIDKRYDLILADINMPEMDGLECAAAIRERGIDTPIVAITADIEKNTPDACIRAGMTGYLAKPLKMDQLQEVLRETSQEKKKKEKKLGMEVHYYFAEPLPHVAAA